MRLIKVFVLFILIGVGPAFCQTNQPIDEAALTEVKAPSSPAATIIGNQPSVINRPKSWNELETSVYSNFLNSNQLVIPNDFALEFSPFWASNKRYVSIEDFMNPGIGQSIVQNLALSVSSTQKFIVNDSTNSNALGFGLRTMIWQGTRKDLQNITIFIKGQRLGARAGTWSQLLSDHITDTLKRSLSDVDYKRIYIEALIDGLHNKFNEEKVNATFANDFFDNLQTDLESVLENTVHNNYSDSIKNIIDRHSKITEFTSNLQQLRKDRNGFKLEIALAVSLNFPTNQTDYSIVPKWGFWLTPSYQLPNNDRVEILGVFRYFHFYKRFYDTYLPNIPSMDNTVDYGGRLVYKWNKYSIEFETVGRHSKTIVSQQTDSLTQLTTTVSKTQNDFQWILNFNYKISDKVILSYNFGKQLDPALKLNGNLISLLTLNYGIGAPKKSDLKL